MAEEIVNGTGDGQYKLKIDSDNSAYVKIINSEGQETTIRRPLPIEFGDNAMVDAFGKLRVSSPQTLFDSKNIFNDPNIADTLENQPLFYDNQETSGTGTSTAYNANESSQSLIVSANTAGTRVRQTFQRFNYQPGKSLLVLMSYIFSTGAAGIVQNEGIFDEKNGLFIQDDEGTIKLVRRTYVTGTAVDNKVAQADWNIDKFDGTGPSGVTIDLTKTNILAIDYEWLGVGRVRIGFVIAGMIYYAHEFLNANNLEKVYMSTPNLPLRSEISNDGTGPASTMTQICNTVVSEGGQNPLGAIRSDNTGGTPLTAATTGTTYALIGIRLKSAYIGEVIELLSASLQVQTGDSKILWEVYLNPTVAGTFTYGGLSHSAVETAFGATANTITGGTLLQSGFAESGGQQQGNVGSVSSDIKNSLSLGSAIDGTVDEIVICVTPIDGSTNVDVEGTLTWREYN